MSVSLGPCGPHWGACGIFVAPCVALTDPERPPGGWPPVSCAVTPSLHSFLNLLRRGSVRGPGLPTTDRPWRRIRRGLGGKVAPRSIAQLPRPGSTQVQARGSGQRVLQDPLRASRAAACGTAGGRVVARRVTPLGRPRPHQPPKAPCVGTVTCRRPRAVPGRGGRPAQGPPFPPLLRRAASPARASAPPPRLLPPTPGHRGRCVCALGTAPWP